MLIDDGLPASMDVPAIGLPGQPCSCWPLQGLRIAFCALVSLVPDRRASSETCRNALSLFLFVDGFWLNNQLGGREICGDGYVMDITHALQGFDIWIVWVCAERIK